MNKFVKRVQPKTISPTKVLPVQESYFSKIFADFHERKGAIVAPINFFEIKRSPCLGSFLSESLGEAQTLTLQSKVKKLKCKSIPLQEQVPSFRFYYDSGLNPEEEFLEIPPRFKLLHFAEDRRPAYWGTWSKVSKFVSGRRPFARDEALLDYEFDSECEWEDEEEGEEIRSDDDEEEEEEGFLDENDDGWLVEDVETLTDGELDPISQTEQSALLQNSASSNPSRIAGQKRCLRSLNAAILGPFPVSTHEPPVPALVSWKVIFLQGSFNPISLHFCYILSNLFLFRGLCI
jgi:hypothetical protein